MDGETDWKLRKAVKVVQKSILNGMPPTQLLEWNACVNCGEPIENIYLFNGVFIMKNGGSKQKESLSLENVMWSSTVLANSKILGLVI